MGQKISQFDEGNLERIIQKGISRSDCTRIVAIGYSGVRVSEFEAKNSIRLVSFN